MTTIRLYWNNICILHRQELAFLEEMKKHLKAQDIHLEVTCFGLGYGVHMSDAIRNGDVPLPDMMVSTDLEVFEDHRIYDAVKNQGLHPLAELFAPRDIPMAAPFIRDEFLLPYLAIPLVFYSADPLPSPVSLADLAEKDIPLAFGGIENSAGKTVVKAVWEAGGRPLAEKLLASASVTAMPIQAFHRVRNGESRLALVPLVYALRADGLHTHSACPKGGAPAVTSYICAKSSLPLSAVEAVIKELRRPEISRFYVENGRLVSFSPESPKEPWLEENGAVLSAPSPKFLKALTPEEFYEVYQTLSPA